MVAGDIDDLENRLEELRELLDSVDFEFDDDAQEEIEQIEELIAAMQNRLDESEMDIQTRKEALEDSYEDENGVLVFPEWTPIGWEDTWEEWRADYK